MKKKSIGLERVTGWKFSPTATDNRPSLLDNYNNVAEFLAAKFTRGMIFGLDKLHSFGMYKIAGWQFDFRPFLRRFVVEQNGHWQAYYAPNKSALRKSLYGRLETIVEIPVKR